MSAIRSGLHALPHGGLASSNPRRVRESGRPLEDTRIAETVYSRAPKRAYRYAALDRGSGQSIHREPPGKAPPATRAARAPGECAAIPELTGHYFFADVCRGWVRSFTMVGNSAQDHRTWDALTLSRTASFGLDGAGEIYMIATTKVFKIVRKDP